MAKPATAPETSVDIKSFVVQGVKSAVVEITTMSSPLVIAVLSLPGVKVNGAELSMSSSLILLSATVTAASFVVTFVNVRLVSLTAAENQSLVAVSAKAEPDAHAIAHAIIPKTFSAFIYSSLKGLTRILYPQMGEIVKGGYLIFLKKFQCAVFSSQDRLCPIQRHRAAADVPRPGVFGISQTISSRPARRAPSSPPCGRA